MKRLLIPFAIAVCALTLLQAEAQTRPNATDNCDPRNPTHVTAKEAMRRATDADDADNACWVYIAAMQGDPLGESDWATLLSDAKHDAEAFAWASKSAAQGNPYGEWNLSIFYENGWGTPANKERAQRWELAALNDPKFRTKMEAQQREDRVKALMDLMDQPIDTRHWCMPRTLMLHPAECTNHY